MEGALITLLEAGQRGGQTRWTGASTDATVGQGAVVRRESAGGRQARSCVQLLQPQGMADASYRYSQNTCSRLDMRACVTPAKLTLATRSLRAEEVPLPQWLLWLRTMCSTDATRTALSVATYNPGDAPVGGQFCAHRNTCAMLPHSHRPAADGNCYHLTDSGVEGHTHRHVRLLGASKAHANLSRQARGMHCTRRASLGRRLRSHDKSNESNDWTGGLRIVPSKSHASSAAAAPRAEVGSEKAPPSAASRSRPISSAVRGVYCCLSSGLASARARRISPRSRHGLWRLHPRTRCVSSRAVSPCRGQQPHTYFRTCCTSCSSICM
jgi:hypothetical protein